MYYYCKKGVLVVHESDVMYYYCKKGVLVVHESDVRCIITVRKECWWYMNQMSDDIITVRKECWWYMNQMYCYCKKGVLVVHESDVRCIITVRKECWWYMNQMSDVLLL